MILEQTLTLLAFATAVLTAPTSPRKSISARDPAVGPTVQPGYSPQETDQIHQAHFDAVKLAFTAVDSAADPAFDRIFAKYFGSKDKDYVISK